MKVHVLFSAVQFRFTEERRSSEGLEHWTKEESSTRIMARWPQRGNPKDALGTVTKGCPCKTKFSGTEAGCRPVIAVELCKMR